MDFQERELLEQTLKLSEENNKMLRKMRRSMRIQGAMRAIYWLLIIGISVGAYYYIQPQINALLNLYGGLQSNVTDVNSILDTFRGSK